VIGPHLMVLVMGDGALQQTASELGPLLASGTAAVVMVLNNDVYAVERAIHEPSASYHFTPRWDRTSLPATVAPATASFAIRASSPQELDRALPAADDNAGRLTLIEAVLGPVDVPPVLRELAQARSMTDDCSGSRQCA
jgi:alpha-keto-acid decarboxylase